MKAALLGLMLAVAATLGTAASAGPPRPANQTLNVTVSGSGQVTSSPSGISCPSKCSGSFADRSTVTLNENPGSGATFVGWGKDCSGTGGCKVVMSGTRNVSATFQ